MKILFIGGNGNISWWCVQTALEKGCEVWELNRGMTINTRREIQPEVHKLTADIKNPDEIKDVIKNLEFDVICDFICFNAKDAETAVDLFKNKTKQFIYISTEAVYKRVVNNSPFKETSAKYSSDIECSYIREKLQAENVLMEAYNKTAFPVTIVRPGYTYDVIVPYSIGHNCFTASKRYREGKPVLIAGNGDNLWTFTHSSDLASAFAGLLGNKKSIGEDFHITSDEHISWNNAMPILLDALGVKNPKYIHIPFEDVLNNGLIGERELSLHRMSNSVFDNSKIKKFIPRWRAKVRFKDGIKQTFNWLFEKDIRRRFNPKVDEMMEILTNITEANNK